MGLGPAQGNEKRIPSGKPLFMEAAPSPLSSHFPNKFVISTGEVMGLGPAQGNEKRIPSGKPLFMEAAPFPLSSHFPNKFVISTGAKRSGEICGSTDLSWKCFSTELSWAHGPPKVMKNALSPATTLHGSASPPLSSRPKRSVAEGSRPWMLLHGNVFRQRVFTWSSPKENHTSRFSRGNVTGKPLQCPMASSGGAFLRLGGRRIMNGQGPSATATILNTQKAFW
jgi:hypothetical protein